MKSQTNYEKSTDKNFVHFILNDSNVQQVSREQAYSYSRVRKHYPRLIHYKLVVHTLIFF
jgi:hypothetical protein